MVNDNKSRDLSNWSVRLEESISTALKSLEVELPETCIKAIVRSLDSNMHYDTMVITSRKFLNKFFNNGYRLVKDEESDYVERFHCYSLFGRCRPGYTRGSKQLTKIYLRDSLVIGVKVKNSFGFSKTKGLIYEDSSTLIIFKEEQNETL